jgi:hypothetical protein
MKTKTKTENQTKTKTKTNTTTTTIKKQSSLVNVVATSEYSLWFNLFV